MGVSPEGSEDEKGEGDDHGRAGEVVDPLAEGEAADGGEGEQGEEDGEGGKDDGVAVGDPGGGGADHEGELGGDLEEEEGDSEETVGPDVPSGEETDGVAEGAAGPDVEAAFEGEFPVEEEDDDGHGGIEDGEGEDPDEGLGVRTWERTRSRRESWRLRWWLESESPDEGEASAGVAAGASLEVGI
jgi:hypothetical protein